MDAVVRAVVEVAAPVEQVWDYVTDWARQGEWIPFTRVEAGEARQIGGRIRAWTGVGGFGFWDTMTITSWDPLLAGAGRCEVLHTGAVIRGEGEFAVRSLAPEACELVWSERLLIPGGQVGGLGWKVVGPLMRRGVNLALRRMAARAEQSYAAG